MFTYTSTKRKYDAGILFMGHGVTDIMVIPPNSLNFATVGLCSGLCTKEYVPSGGIHIFANMLHTHLAGVGLKLSHISNTQCSESISTNQELPPIEMNLHYDFNFQQATHLPQEITIQPGDHLMLECFYNTTGRSGVTLGGESTQEEMCLSFPVYYPRMKLADCISFPLFDNLDQFINNYVPDKYKQAFRNLHPGLNRELMEYIMNLLDWTQEQIDGYQRLIYQTGLHGSFCGQSVFPAALPQLSCCSYEARNVCSGYEPAPCCQRKCINSSIKNNPSSVHITALVCVLIMCLLF
jgi:hypothetical protein